MPVVLQSTNEQVVLPLEVPVVPSVTAVVVPVPVPVPVQVPRPYPVEKTVERPVPVPTPVDVPVPTPVDRPVPTPVGLVVKKGSKSRSRCSVPKPSGCPSYPCRRHPRALEPWPMKLRP